MKKQPPQPKIVSTMADLDQPPVTKITVDPERLAIAGPFGNRIGLMIATGNWEGAKEVMGEAKAAMRQDDSGLPFFSTPLGEIGLSIRTLNMLEESHQAINVGHLIRVPVAALFATPNVGESTVNEIWRVVLSYSAKRIDRKG